MSKNKETKATAKRRWYRAIHIIDFVFLIVLILFIFSEAGKYNFKNLNLNVCDAKWYASLQNWFGITDDDAMTHDLFVNQIIIVLIPLFVTIIAIAFSLIGTRIFGIFYSEFRKFSYNRAYNFLTMILISLFLFVSDIVLYYFHFIFCTLIINAIALIYIIMFCCAEVPLLSRETWKINKSLRNAYSFCYPTGDDNFVSKRNFENVMSKILEDEGLLAASRRLKTRGDDDMEYLEPLFSIYISTLINKTKEGLLSDPIINDFLRCVSEYISLRKTIGFNADKLDVMSSSTAASIYNFLKMLDIKNQIHKEALQTTLSMLIPSAKSKPSKFRSIIAEGMCVFSKDEKFTIQILNDILVHSIAEDGCTEIIKSFLDLFIKQNGYISKSNKTNDPTCFLIISIYLYYLNKMQGISSKISSIYKEIKGLKNYSKIIKSIAYISSQNSASIEDLSVLLNYLLDCYITYHDASYVDIDPWTKFIFSLEATDDYFFQNEVCNWWITLLFVLKPECNNNFANNVVNILGNERASALASAYKNGWHNDGTFKEYTKYTSFFTDVCPSLNISLANEQVKNMMEEFSKKYAQVDEPADTASDSNDNIDAKNSKIRKYFDKQTRQFEFYSSKNNEQNGTLSERTYTLYYSNETDHRPFGVPTLHQGLSYYFNSDSPQNIFAYLLHADMVFGNNNVLKIVNPINKYTDAINQKIIEFEPTRKYAPEMDYITNEGDNKQPQNYLQILKIKDTDPSIRLVKNTFLKDDAIKMYIKFKGASKAELVTDKDEILRFVKGNPCCYGYAPNNVFRYMTRNTYVILNKDEIVDTLNGKLYKINIKFEYQITYDTNKLLIYCRSGIPIT